MPATVNNPRRGHGRHVRQPRNNGSLITEGVAIQYRWTGNRSLDFVWDQAARASNLPETMPGDATRSTRGLRSAGPLSCADAVRRTAGERCHAGAALTSHGQRPQVPTVDAARIPGPSRAAAKGQQPNRKCQHEPPRIEGAALWQCPATKGLVVGAVPGFPGWHGRSQKTRRLADVSVAA
jgi:hypothetical protein